MTYKAYTPKALPAPADTQNFIDGGEQPVPLLLTPEEACKQGIVNKSYVWHRALFNKPKHNIQ